MFCIKIILSSINFNEKHTQNFKFLHNTDFLRRYDFSILTLGKKVVAANKILLQKGFCAEMEKYTRYKELYMSLPLINKQFMKQGLAITIATMKMNVTHATTEPQEIQQLGTDLNALFFNEKKRAQIVVL